MRSTLWHIVLERIASAGIKRVVISGGEPLLVRNLESLLCQANQVGLITSLITNGLLLTSERIVSLVHHLDEIVISIDGASSQMHRTMRESPETHFANIVRCLRELSKYEVRRRVNTVVTQINETELEDLGFMLADYGVEEWRLLQFYPMNDAATASTVFELSPRRFQAFRTRMLNRYKNTNLRLTFGDNASMSGSYFSLAPDGTVFTSEYGKVIRLGHIMTDSIEQMGKHSAFNVSRHRDQYEVLQEWDA